MRGFAFRRGSCGRAGDHCLGPSGGSRCPSTSFAGETGECVVCRPGRGRKGFGVCPWTLPGSSTSQKRSGVHLCAPGPNCPLPKEHPENSAPGGGIPQEGQGGAPSRDRTLLWLWRRRPAALARRGRVKWQSWRENKGLFELSALLRDVGIVAAQNTVPGRESTGTSKVLP